MTLVEFLTARLDEDEATARDERIEDIPGDCWGPKRILREIEAKRRVVEIMAEHDDTSHGLPPTCDVEDVLAVLAAVYSDHPDYDPAWKV